MIYMLLPQLRALQFSGQRDYISLFGPLLQLRFFQQKKTWESSKMGWKIPHSHRCTSQIIGGVTSSQSNR